MKKKEKKEERKLKIEPPYDPAISLLGVWLKEIKTGSWRDTGTAKFITALFTIAKIGKQLKCPSMNEWVKKMWYIHAIEHYSAMRKKETLPFKTWMKLEDIMLSEVTQRKTNTVWPQLYVESERDGLRKRERGGGCQSLGLGENGEVLDEGYKFPALRWIHSGDSIFSLVIMVEKTSLRAWKLLRELILNILTTHTQNKEMVITWEDKSGNHFMLLKGIMSTCTP